MSRALYTRISGNITVLNKSDKATPKDSVIFCPENLMYKGGLL